MSAARRYSPVPPTTIGRRPGGEQPVDLGVRELGVLANAEARVERQERDEAVLELGALGRGGDAGERLQTRVHLQRVRGHGHRVLPGRPQPLGERDRDRGLADAGGAEEREHLAGRGRRGGLGRRSGIAPQYRGLGALSGRLRGIRLPMRIPGSTVLLTGATGGIGHAIARELHGRGARLILTGRRAEVLRELGSELDADVLAADLADRAAVERLLAKWATWTSSSRTPACPGRGCSRTSPSRSSTGCST